MSFPSGKTAPAGSSDIMKKKNTNSSTDTEKARAKRSLLKIGIIAGNFLVLFLLLRFLISLSEQLQQIWIYYAAVFLYTVIAAGCIIGFFVLNGMTFGKEPRTADDLPERWTEERKNRFLEKQPERREKAKKLLYILLPLIAVFFISYIELTFLS